MPRYTIELGEVAEHQVLHIASELGVMTKRGIVVKALGLLKYITEHMQEGWEVFVENPSRSCRKQIVSL